jgi:WhiB family redox-sensing transcriptional regulator
MTDILLVDTRSPAPPASRVPCSADPEAWYDHNRNGDTKKICAACPVKATCLDVAMKLDEPWGVWGGFTADERLRLAAGQAPQQCGRCGVDFVPVVAATDCEACVVANPPWPIDDDVPAIRRLAAAGFSDAVIGERLHRNPNTVKSCRNRHGIPSMFTRTKKPGRAKQVLLGCGTSAAYRRHQRKDEPIDEACRRANALEKAERRAAQKAAASRLAGV